MSTQPHATPPAGLPGHRNPPPPPSPTGSRLAPALTYLRAKVAAAALDPDHLCIMRASHVETLLQSYDEQQQQLRQRERPTVCFNQKVTVTLNALGLKIWTQGGYPPHMAATGELHVELWMLMYVFGPHLFNGADLPFTTNGFLLEPLCI